MNILLIDDDAVDRLLIVRSLSHQPEHQITEVADSTQAFAIIKQFHFDAILLDYQMPSMNGLKMLAQLKNLPEVKHTALIMLSHNHDEQLLLESITAGAQDFLIKSDITPRQLSRTLLQAKKRFELESKLNESYEQLKQLAESDPLTGIANRYRFDKALEQTIQQNQRSNQYVALFILDLDRFKHINDNFGHQVGDKLIQGVAQRLQEKLRSSELIARLGGDEFALIFNRLSSINQVNAIARRVSQLFNEPFYIDQHVIHCQCSIGIALHPLNSVYSEELKKFADIAMYRAKHSENSHSYLFEDNMQKEFSRCYQVETELRQALSDQDFALAFQPIITTHTRQIIGFEALIRWPHAKTCNQPNEFIPIAEEAHLIAALGQWVVEQAISQFQTIRPKYSFELCLAINLSLHQLHDNILFERLQSAFQHNELTPQQLVFEISGSTLDNADILPALNKLRQLGCRIALDNFGRNSTAIQHIMKYPIDIIKLDQELIAGAVTNKRYAAIMANLCTMFKQIDILIIAEGVETQAQYQLCQRYDVDAIQGFLLARPQPISTLSKELTSE
ncbi:putative bifunctional diguanylate cyclase/phosphodiesterase [Celerinatantimonas yamalensis]|uniref:EAL domain-containing protein n=1 Tax=Celerinatantimonas yamalensis TaxID=559956 RepID=A0ABW9G616_9GAMM